MSFIERLFPAKATITAAGIRAEITKAESEANTLRAKIDGMMDGIGAMTDEQHVAAEANAAALRRAITRLEARANSLAAELPSVLAAEEAAAKAEADAALIKRAVAARKANERESAALLREYDSHASAIGDILTKLKALDAETAEINTALRSNPVAEPIQGWNHLHRKHPDQIASEHRTMAPHWVYKDAPPQPGEVAPGETETAVLATIDDRGNPVRPGGVQYGRFRQIIQPQLQDREVITRTQFRPGRAEESLDSVRLPPAFTGAWHWPRS